LRQIGGERLLAIVENRNALQTRKVVLRWAATDVALVAATADTERHVQLPAGFQAICRELPAALGADRTATYAKAQLTVDVDDPDRNRAMGTERVSGARALLKHLLQMQVALQCPRAAYRQAGRRRRCAQRQLERRRERLEFLAKRILRANRQLDGAGRGWLERAGQHEDLQGVGCGPCRQGQPAAIARMGGSEAGDGAIATEPIAFMPRDRDDLATRYIRDDDPRPDGRVIRRSSRREGSDLRLHRSYSDRGRGCRYGQVARCRTAERCARRPVLNLPWIHSRQQL